MTLHPPSFFQTALLHSSENPSKEATLTAQSIQVPTITNCQEELAKLRQGNKLLREQLEVKTNPISTADTVLHPNQQQPLLHLTSHVPILTSDLLHVEECLQSRVKLLEGEKKSASLQILELEEALMLQKKEFHEQTERLTALHEEILCKVEHDKQKLSLEYQTFRENNGKRVLELEAALSAQHDQNSAQVEQFSSRVTELEHNYSFIESDKRRAIQDFENKLASVSEQLALSKAENENLKNESNAKLMSLTAQVTTHHQRVRELEAYLGGEIPGINGDMGGTTWKEEREQLSKDIQKYNLEVQRMLSENKLLNIRLTSLSEILTLQETDLTKRCGKGIESVRGLLRRWREKVFELLVKQKLQEIEDSRNRKEFHRKETSLTQKVEECEAECELLSLSVADKSAQLQLQEAKTEEAEVELKRTKARINELKSCLQTEHNMQMALSSHIRIIAKLFGGFKSSFNQALTRLANYEYRVTSVAKRIQSLRATRYALLQSQIVTKTDAGCQVCEDVEEQYQGISTLTREQLELEVQNLCGERDSLIGQLGDSTVTFQQQIKSMTDRYMAERKEFEGFLLESETKHASLEQELTKVQDKLDNSEKEKATLTERVQDLERQLRELRASMDSRVESELMKQEQRSREELAEMEKLLNVARREHSNAIVKLQQLTRQLAQDKERAAEVAEVGRARLERELAMARKKLQSVQVERNVLLTTLRQEGILAPLNSKQLKRPCEIFHDQPQVQTSLSCPESSSSSSEGDQEMCRQQQHHHGSQQDQEDIRDVLKDLQMLSASILSMEPELEAEQHTKP